MGGYLMQSMKRNPADATHSNGPYAEDWFDVYDSPQESWDGLLAFGGNDENWFRHNSTNPLKADGTTYVFEGPRRRQPPTHSPRQSPQAASRCAWSVDRVRRGRTRLLQ